MTTVGIREFKARLSHYMQLVQAGEEIAITLRDQVIGYLSKKSHRKEEKKEDKQKREDVEKILDEMERNEKLVRGRGKYRPSKPVKLRPGAPLMQDLVRQMRDEEW